jgi:hypothetical protein
MKKNVKLMCVALVLSTTTMAQQAKTEPAAQEQATAKRGTKIVFPPNSIVEKIVWPMGNRSATVVGTTDEGVVIENAAGQNILINKDNKATILESSARWTPVVPKPKDPIVYKLVGTAENGNAVWEGPDGKSCTLDLKTGKANAYGAKVEKFTIPKPRG